MDLELTTLNDIVDELRRRRMRFVLVAVEPSNNQHEATIMHAAQGIHAQDMLGLVKLAWHQVIKETGENGGAPPGWN